MFSLRHIFTYNAWKLPNKIVNKQLRLSSSTRNISYHMESNSGQFESKRVDELFEIWKNRFKYKSISEPEESVINIFAYCLNTRKLCDVQRMKSCVLSRDKIEEINRLCEKRLDNMPIQYIIKEWQFRSLTLKMSPPVFIPRPETEQLVDLVLKEIDSSQEPEVLDLCCGSGAIALSLLHERPLLKATAIDQSEAACTLTMENAQRLGLDKRIRVINTPLQRPGVITEKVGLIVSNPPYIFSEDMDELQDEIKLFEDAKALDGGEDGLDVIKLILNLSSQVLCQGAKLFLEVDPRHPQMLRSYLIKNSALRLDYACNFQDFTGRERFVKIIKI